MLASDIGWDEIEASASGIQVVNVDEGQDNTNKDQNFYFQAEEMLNPPPVVPTLGDNDNDIDIDDDEDNIHEGDGVPKKKRARQQRTDYQWNKCR